MNPSARAFGWRNAGIIAVAALLLGGSLALQAQSIDTRAGGGSTAIEGLPATSVVLSSIHGLAVDANGNVYVSDRDTNTVYRIDAATKIITAFAGNGGGTLAGDNGPARQAGLKGPRAIAFDPSGNLYIADHDNGRIRRVAAGTGIITTVAGSDRDDSVAGNGDGGPATAAFLRGPTSVAWHQGSLYISDDGYRENNIRRVDPQGIITTYAGKGDFPAFSGDGGPALAADFDEPQSVVLDGAGNLYIADGENNRVRRVDAVSKVITTVVGGGTPNDDDVGDGGPGTKAVLARPSALAFDRLGKLHIADANNRYGLIRRWDPVTGIVDTVAGNGTYGGGDGKVATEAGIYAPSAIAFDAADNLFVHDAANGTVRRVDATTRIIQTYAGGGTFIGDGRVATTAVLQTPLGIAFDRNRNLLIADSGHSLVRKVDAITGVISTFAGILNDCCGGEITPGAAATDVKVGFPFDIAVDSAGNAYLADPYSGRVLRVDAAGKITVYAGGGSPADETGDNGPATEARIVPLALAFDSTNNLYIVDHAYGGPHRIRRVDAQTRQITTVAGGKESGFAGDGGPASAALLHTPNGVAVDRTGNIYISDNMNGAIRRIDAGTGTITTYAGRGEPADDRGDNLPATSARMFPKHIAIDARNGDLYIADERGHRLRRVDASTRVITTIAGTGASGESGDFAGDNGAAAAARLNLGFELSGIVVDDVGRVFFADSKNNRIRVVNACRAATASTLIEPAEEASTTTGPRLSWQNARASEDRALRYDVYVSTDPSAATLVASDVTSPSVNVSNLQPGTKYFWRVVAKSDRFCTNLPPATSAIRSFTTASGCAEPGPVAALAPADNASVSTASTTLTWSASAGAGSYDVLLGTSNPPPFAASTSATSFAVPALAPGTTYYWSVIARSSCDRERTSATAVRSFRTSGSCPAPGTFTDTAPASGATGVSTETTLAWAASPNATSYDVSFGTSAEPPIFLLGVTTNRVRVSGLLPGQTYFWRVTARVACDSARTASTPVVSFTVRGTCRPPRATSFTSVPAGAVAVGQTYAVSWDIAEELNDDGYYVVERSLSSSFAPILDAQSTASTSASFVAASPGTLYHRVRTVNPCTTDSPASSSRVVIVVGAPPNVTFTVQPQAVVTALGEKLEEKRGRFVLENIGDEAVTVLVGRQELDSVPFFTIRDPAGGDPSVLQLAPRQPKELELRFSGPPNDSPGSYQGIVVLSSLGKPLAITPYAFVSLRVGGGSEAAAPQFRVGGTRTEYAYFPGFSGDDAARPPITVEIHNPGSTPMELAGEIGPELWLVPESGWNATPIPAGESLVVKLFTQRNRAPNGSALPRYTYWRVRTRNGQSARLLVQDSDVRPTGAGRGAALDAASRSLIVSEAVSRPSGRSTLRLSNVGSDAVQVELFFTPEGADGFDATRVKRASINVPANDVVTLRDPLVQLWELATPARGQIEVRTDPSRIGLLGVRAEVVATSATGGQVGTVSAVHSRGEGASIGNAHAIVGVTSNSRTRPVLTLSETSGVDRVTVRITLDDKDGNRKGTRTEELQRYGGIEIDEIVTSLGGSSGVGAQVGIEVLTGGGAVAGVVKLMNRVSGGGALLVSTPVQLTPTTNLRGIRADAEDSRSYYLPAILNSPASGSSPKLQTTMGLSAVRGSATFALTYRDATRTRTANAEVASGRTVEYANVLEQLLGFAAGEATEGTLLVETNGSGRMYARLTSVDPSDSLASVSQDLTVIGSDSELVTSPQSQRPLFLDGLSQTIDGVTGSRWSLWLNELNGRSGSVFVRLYEAGNRGVPIAEKRFPLGAFRTLAFDDLFAAMELTGTARSKDRENLLLSVTFADGEAAVTAIARSLDRLSFSTRAFALAPAGIAPLDVSKVSVVAPEPVGSPKRRTSRP
jgi:sugar lactone lactonase YvrE